MELAPNPHYVAKALGGSFKLVTLTPRTGGKATVTTRIRLRFDGRSTAYNTSQGHSDVT